MTDRVSALLRPLAESYVPDWAKDRMRDTIARLLEHRVRTYRELRDDVPTWYFDQARTYTFDEPDYYNELPEEISKLFGTHECPQPYVMELQDVTVLGEQGILLTEDGEYLTYNFDRAPSQQARQDAAREVAYDVVDALGSGTWPFPARRRSGDVPEYDLVVPLLNRWARNYSHWTEECLPLLEGVRHYVAETGAEPTIIIPPDPPSFVTESLHVLGYSERQYRELPADRIHANRLVAPSPRRFDSDTGTDYVRMLSGLEWLRETVMENVPHDDSLPSKLLISRQDAATRRIVNRQEVENQLADRGFETIVLSEIGYVKQKQLFSQAEVVVGTHGAGLNEIAFAEDAAVVELFGDYIVPIFYEIATGRGLPYACLRCRDIDGDIEVDVDELHHAIDVLTEGTNSKPCA